MNLQVAVGILLASLALPLLGWAVFARPDRARAQAVANLRRDYDSTVRDAAPIGPMELAPRPSRLVTIGRALTPVGQVKRLDHLLARAGRPPDWPLDRVLAVKVVLLAVGAVLGLLFFARRPDGGGLVFGVAIALFGFYAPDLMVLSRAQERSQKIREELADTLDQMVIAVEAGLGFEAAMAHAARNGRGPLAEEFIRTLQDIQVGQSRRVAYKAMGERNEVPDLRRFVSAIIQADQYGISVGDVLRTQAGEMRMRRRQRAEEKAMQVPVKVVFPLVFCILPVLFIVVLGPAVRDIASIFS